MISDDLTALASICMGALVPAVLTLSLLTQESEPPRVGEPVAPVTSIELYRRAPSNIVDFAIIRGQLGEEGSPESLEMRLLRTR